jgi:predicted Zn-dependent protease
VIGRLCISALGGVLLVAQDVNFHSKEKEAALGTHMAGEVRRRTSALGDSTVLDYTAWLGRHLAAQVPSRDLDWEFAVIRDYVGGSTHEALSVPGGHIFVSTSLFLAVDSEAELAGMLAHAIAHITERHGMRIATSGQVSNFSTIPLVFIIGSWMGMCAAGNDGGAAVPLGYLKIQRSNELDADRVAVNIMAASEYDPAALLEYVRRTQRALPSESRMYLALPTREERIGALETAVANLRSRSGPSDGEFNAIRNRVRELVKLPPSLR